MGLKLFFIFLAILLFTQNSFAGTGRADVYKITIRQIAMCETGSTLSNCLNPVIIFTGNSADSLEFNIKSEEKKKMRINCNN